MGYFDSFPFLVLLIFLVHKDNFLQVKIKNLVAHPANLQFGRLSC